VGCVLGIGQFARHQVQRKVQILLQVAVLQRLAVAAHQLGQHLGATGQHQNPQRHADQQTHQGLAALLVWVGLHGAQQRAWSPSRLGPLLCTRVAT